MPWVSPAAVVQHLIDGFADARERVGLVTVVFDGATFDLFRSDRIGDDLVMRVQDDPSPEAVRAIQGALAVLGVDLDVLRVCVRPQDVELAGIGEAEARRYAVLVDKLRHQERVSEPRDDTPQRGLQGHHDSVVSPKELVLGANCEHPHSSPPVGVSGDPSVGEPSASGTADAEGAATRLHEVVLRTAEDLPLRVVGVVVDGRTMAADRDRGVQVEAGPAALTRVTLTLLARDLRFEAVSDVAFAAGEGPSTPAAGPTSLVGGSR